MPRMLHAHFSDTVYIMEVWLPILSTHTCFLINWPVFHSRLDWSPKVKLWKVMRQYFLHAESPFCLPNKSARALNDDYRYCPKNHFGDKCFAAAGT